MEKLHAALDRAVTRDQRRSQLPGLLRRASLTGKALRRAGATLGVLAALAPPVVAAPTQAETVVRWTSTASTPAWDPAANNTPRRTVWHRSTKALP